MKGLWKLIYPKQTGNVLLNFGDGYTKIMINNDYSFGVEYKVINGRCVKFTHHYPFTGVVVSPFRMKDDKMFFRKNFIVPHYSHETNMILERERNPKYPQNQRYMLEDDYPLARK